MQMFDACLHKTKQHTFIRCYSNTNAFATNIPTEFVRTFPRHYPKILFSVSEDAMYEMSRLLKYKGRRLTLLKPNSLADLTKQAIPSATNCCGNWNATDTMLIFRRNENLTVNKWSHTKMANFRHGRKCLELQRLLQTT